MGKSTNQNNRENISNSRKGSPRMEKHNDNNGRGHYSHKMRLEDWEDLNVCAIRGENRQNVD